MRMLLIRVLFLFLFLLALFGQCRHLVRLQLHRRPAATTTIHTLCSSAPITHVVSNIPSNTGQRAAQVAHHVSEVHNRGRTPPTQPALAAEHGSISEIDTSLFGDCELLHSVRQFVRRVGPMLVRSDPRRERRRDTDQHMRGQRPAGEAHLSMRCRSSSMARSCAGSLPRSGPGRGGPSKRTPPFGRGVGC